MLISRVCFTHGCDTMHAPHLKTYQTHLYVTPCRLPAAGACGSRGVRKLGGWQQPCAGATASRCPGTHHPAGPLHRGVAPQQAHLQTHHERAPDTRAAGATSRWGHHNLPPVSTRLHTTQCKPPPGAGGICARAWQLEGGAGFNTLHQCPLVCCDICVHRAQNINQGCDLTIHTAHTNLNAGLLLCCSLKNNMSAFQAYHMAWVCAIAA